MIQAASPNTLWYPGKKIEDFGGDSLTARAREIAKSREELLGLLHGLPESDYELSYTNLVERSQSDHTNTEGWTTNDALPEREVNQAQGVVQKTRKDRKGSSSLNRSSSRGVLLNMYVPTSLKRSLMSSCASRGTTNPKVTAEITQREREGTKWNVFGCWPAILYRRSEKSRKKGNRKNKMREYMCCGFY